MTVDADEETVLIENGIVVTVDESNQVKPDAAVLLAGDEIVAIGDSAELSAGTNVDKRVDASGKAVLPGFVDLQAVEENARGLTPGLNPIGRETNH